MKILEILSDTNRGGAGVYLENYIAHAAPDMEILVALPEGAAMADRLKAAGAQVVECALQGDRSYDKRDVETLRVCIETFSPDLVHTHGSLSGRIAARRAGRCKTVYTKHTLSEPRKGLKGRVAAMMDDRLTDAVIAVSNAARENLLEDGVKHEKIHRIYNGITGFAPADVAQKCAARRALGPSPESVAIGTCEKPRDAAGGLLNGSSAKPFFDSAAVRRRVAAATTGSAGRRVAGGRSHHLFGRARERGADLCRRRPLCADLPQ